MSDLGERTMRKAIWRLVPFLALLYTFPQIGLWLPNELYK